MTPNDATAGSSFVPPQIQRTPDGDIVTASLADVIQWFLDFDERVAIIKDRRVEEVFQWKQEHSKQKNENVFLFNHAEDRLAIGIIQALAEHATEYQLHEWISKLLNVLDEATKATEEIAESYKLDKVETESTVTRAAAIPTENGRMVYLNDCWLEALCTAEIRVLGWVYKDLFGRPFSPGNFPHHEH
jgi:hypothetical protein